MQITYPYFLGDKSVGQPLLPIQRWLDRGYRSRALSLYRYN